MEHQVYQAVQVCHQICDGICFDYLVFFLGEKGEAGLPGPGFPGKEIILFLIRNISIIFVILGAPGPVGPSGERGFPGMN
jgi:hypothetical protein